MADAFWTLMTDQLGELREARTADDVMRILSPERNGQWHAGSGEGFYAGSGGDGSVLDSLMAAGWVVTWMEASYYYVLKGPEGHLVTYCEGDVDRGDLHV